MVLACMMNMQSFKYVHIQVKETIQHYYINKYNNFKILKYFKITRIIHDHFTIN